MQFNVIQNFLKQIQAALTRSHETVFVAYIAFFISNLIVYIQLSISEQEASSHYIALVCVLLIYGVYKLTRAYRMCSHGILALNYVHIFYTAWLTGGVHSPAMSWYTFMPTAALMLGRRSALFWLTMSLVATALLAAVNYTHPDIQNHHLSADQALWSVVMQITIAIGLLLSIWLYEILNTQRSAQLEEKSLEIAQTHRQLERAQAHKDEFIASVSHELRTPMNAILGFNELLSLEVKSAKAQQISEHIQTSAKQLLRVISDILDYSQLMANKLNLVQHASDPRKLVQHAAEKARLQAKDKPIQIELNIETTTPKLCSMDSARIAQVLDHLLSNAVKFMTMGRIEIFMRARNDFLRIEVKDNGIGVSPEQQQSIFKRFSHANTEINRRYGGTGLGLAICDRLIQLHQGTIGVNSELGKGSVFWFEIPTQGKPSAHPSLTHPEVETEQPESDPNLFDTHVHPRLRPYLKPIEIFYFWMLHHLSRQFPNEVKGHKVEALMNLLIATNLFAPVYFLLSTNPILDYIYLGYPFMYVLGLLIIIKLGHPRLMVHILLTLSCLFLVAISAYLGGSHGTMNWLALIPLAALNLLGFSASLVWLGITIATQLGMVYATQHDGLPISAETVQQPLALFAFAYMHMTIVILNLPLSYKNLTARIRRKLKIKTAKLELTQIKLLNEQQQKDEFIASVSHEFRTPMNAIIGFNHLLKAEIKDEKRACELQAHVTHSAEHLLTVIDDILDYSQLQTGNLNIRREAFNVHQVIHNAFAMFQPRVNAQVLDYRLKIGEVPRWVAGDNHRLMQVLVNLIGNALKFTEVGFVEIRVQALNQGVLFEIEDSGIGISADKLPLIFGHYEQAHAQESKRYAGNGLGLAISKRLVEIQNGSIQVQSTLDQGSCFSVWLPYPACDAPDHPPIAPDTQSVIAQNLKILVVDDHPLNRLLARQVLQQAWPQSAIDEAADGLKALQKLRHMDFDIVLMDMVMPEMDGIEATQIIRTAFDEPTRNVPILGLTANINPTGKTQCLQAGMNEIIYKPFRTEDLVSTIERLTRLSKVKESARQHRGHSWMLENRPVLDN